MTFSWPWRFLLHGQIWSLMLLNWENVFVQYIKLQLAIIRQVTGDFFSLKAETWAMTAATLNRMWGNVKAKDDVSSDSLLSKLDIQDLVVVVCTSRMRWSGHVEPSTGWIAKVRKLNVVTQKRPGRPKKTWDEVLVDWKKEAWNGFCWHSEPFWVERIS